MQLLSRKLRGQLRHWLVDRDPLIGYRRAARKSQLDPNRSERADHSARREFLQEHLFIHTHLPKTGGSALSDGLMSIFGGVHCLDVRMRRSHHWRALKPAEKNEIHLVSGHFTFGVHWRVNRIPLYIAAVREPVSRAVSGYRYMLATPEASEHAAIQGMSFDEAWAEMDRRDDWQRRNLQARMLMGDRETEDFTWEDLRRRADDDYFLLTPQPEIGTALRKLRAAFGIPGVKAQRINVSPGDAVTPSPEMAERVRAANPLDTRLYDHVADTFDARLDNAITYIASRCLQTIEDGAKDRDQTE